METDLRSSGRLAGDDYETEALVAELVERIEVQTGRVAQLEEQLERAQSERDRLEAELGLALNCVHELTERLVEAEARLGERGSTLSERLAHTR